MATDPSTIQLTKEQQAQLARLAEEQDRSWDEVLTDALRSAQDSRRTVNGTAESESAFDVAKRLGLIGSMKGGPSDLSTNPKHMEGFGRRANRSDPD